MSESTRVNLLCGTLDSPPTARRAAMIDAAMNDAAMVVLTLGRPLVAELPERATAAGAMCLKADTVEQLCWLSSVRQPSVVVVEGELRAVIDAVREIAGRLAAPLVALIDGSSSPDVVPLLEAGADVVVAADAGVDEVMARVAAVARRARTAGPTGVHRLTADGLMIDLMAHTCSVDGRPIDLSPIEYRLLVLLMSNPLRALAASDIVRHVWGWSHADGRNSLRIRVNRLRPKLGDPAAEPRFIGAVRGVGYRFLRPVSQSGSGTGDLSGPVSMHSIVNAISKLATGLLDPELFDQGLVEGPGVDAVGRRLVGLLGDAGVADGVALFRAGEDALKLVASTGLSARWLAVVASGVPLSAGYVSAHNVMAGEAIQLVDLQADRRFPSSADIALQEGFRSVLLVPVVSSGRVWGQLGVARRASEPFDAATAAYLASGVALFAHLLETLA